MVQAERFTFSTPEGIALCDRIIKKALPSVEPHSYQLEGVAKLLDSISLLAILGTGAGKLHLSICTCSL
jgi:hypothetical protein